MDKNKTERVFEDELEAGLLTVGGYERSLATDFDLELGLDLKQLFTFIESSQADSWNQLVSRYGGSIDKAQAGFASRLDRELSERGTVEVLRQGVKDQGVKLALAYPRPPTSMNEALARGFDANRLTVTRQLRYSARHANTIDVGLLVNGILVATAELKNPLTGQDVSHAIDQYCDDRDARSDRFLNRPVVHFAVDPFLAYMTTALRGRETVFLPFNRGNGHGKGNPPSDGFATSYLWESVWLREAWLDILLRFVQRNLAGAYIFPRFHQWRAVKALEADARVHGAGKSYLVQHSTGAGKSNSIAWLADRLSNLHGDDQQRVFHKIVVITDRRVLDSALRTTVQQFERVAGVVEAVTGETGPKSRELAEALSSPTSRIVVTTLQTFPYVIDLLEGADLRVKRWAVIIDEAHSSQTGEAAAALRRALGSGDVDEDLESDEALADLMAARGRQPNISFFAFTATPKPKTLVVFGTEGPGGQPEPFDLYSMRQALEEKFILDVLANYSSWKTYYRLATVSEEAARRELEVGKASSALKRVLVHHPEVISQKAKIVVEHFVNHTAEEIGGLAKAMVVTDSKESALRYKQAIDTYVAEQGYQVKSLVAFSQSVADDLLGDVTEATMNGFPESQTADRFKGVEPYDPADFQVLVVCNKFQTGFDEPLLHTMFVDKVLGGLNAVQTLSRLNRTMPGKQSTFVLDFRNDPEVILSAFQDYYEATIAEAIDFNVLTDAYSRVFDFTVLDADEVAAVVARHFGSAAPAGLGKVYAAFAPTVSRWSNLDAELQGEFKAALIGFLNAYSFLSQVLPWSDLDCERLYVFGRALVRLLPARPDGQLQLGTDVILTHLRLEQREAYDLVLEPGGAEPKSALPGEGRGPRHEGRKDSLGNITEDLNKHFGLNLTERDRLVFEQFELSWLADEDLRAVAQANDVSDFRLEFEKAFKRVILENEEANRDLYQRLVTDPRLEAHVLDWYLGRLYQVLRSQELGATSERPPEDAGSEV